MIFPRQQLVVPDGSGSTSVPESIRWAWDLGVDVTIPVAVIVQSGSVQSLAAATVVLAFRKWPADVAALLQVALTVASPSSAGLGSFVLPRALLAAKLGVGRFSAGVLFRSAGALDDTVLRSAIVEIGYRQASADDPVDSP